MVSFVVTIGIRLVDFVVSTDATRVHDSEVGAQISLQTCSPDGNANGKRYLIMRMRSVRAMLFVTAIIPWT